MKYLIRSSLIISLILFTGCAANKQKLSADLQKELDEPLYCEGEDQCKEMWERATFFVNANAGFKIQIHNDTIIQTYNPTNSSPRLAFSITREPLGGGKYQIWTKVWCANMFGCQPNQFEATARAKRYVRTGRK
ncbi:MULTISPECIES: hypothetical protein [unclassified Microbulbifer]|uniref:hypothetical protein n=1 Tax=unclassified Microbulbifer TaxID=2619833 RepID=UPI0027E4645E|nr:MULTISPECIES: hypothetical protein [unclassified Microbulbifer]